MEPWHLTTLILCGFGLLKELRPSEPFVTEYILDFKNVTSNTLIHVIFPVSTYTILATLIVVFLVTDFLRYKAVIVFQALCYVITWVTLIWGKDLLAMKVVQIFYGFAISADVAYYTYIYAQVRHEHYKKVTSYTYTAAFVGKFLAGASSQLLVSTGLMNYHQLNFVTLASLSSALILSFSLPKVDKSIYFHRLESTPRNDAENCYNCGNNSSNFADCNKNDAKRLTAVNRLPKAYALLWVDFRSAYRNSYILKWSIWWALAMAGNLQVQSYVQALWKVVDSSVGSRRYNGAVNAVQCLLCALLSFAVGQVHIQWNKWGETVLGLISVFQGALLLYMSQTDSLMVAYVAFVIFRVLYQVMITIANSEVAQGVSSDSCGLIFGINTFLALILQTALTLSVSDEKGLALDERTQFFVYGACFGVMGAAFCTVAVLTFFKNGFADPHFESTTFDKSVINTKETQKLHVAVDSIKDHLGRNAAT